MALETHSQHHHQLESGEWTRETRTTKKKKQFSMDTSFHKIKIDKLKTCQHHNKTLIKFKVFFADTPRPHPYPQLWQAIKQCYTLKWAREMLMILPVVLMMMMSYCCCRWWFQLNKKFFFSVFWSRVFPPKNFFLPIDVIDIGGLFYLFAGVNIVILLSKRCLYRFQCGKLNGKK